MDINERLDKVFHLNKQYEILTTWDIDFIESLKFWHAKGRKLSAKQNDLLQKMEAKLSTDALEEHLSWEKNWDSEKARNAQICAIYYSYAGYFTALSKRVMADPEWILPRLAYKKMCCNQYAKKVIDAVVAKPAYSFDNPVILRACAIKCMSQKRFLELESAPLFIIDVLPYVKSSAKGSKIYKVLAANLMEPFEIEERYIKRHRKPKA